MAPSASYHSSWAVAYIVGVAGVAGVAQAVLGAGQTALTGGDIPRRLVLAELAGTTRVVIAVLLVSMPIGIAVQSLDH